MDLILSLRYGLVSFNFCGALRRRGVCGAGAETSWDAAPPPAGFEGGGAGWDDAAAPAETGGWDSAPAPAEPAAAPAYEYAAPAPADFGAGY
jgi:hypothetical protein